MRKFSLLLTLLHVCIFFAAGQAKTRRLPGIINHPSINVQAPYISHDGNALLFVSDMGEDGALIVAYTSRENDWVEPVELPKTINNRSVFLKGFALSADGKRMYFTSAKAPVVGGYDILSSELKGKTWTEPQNLFMPVNSKANEGCPSPTADGKSLYFMRCDNMNYRTASGCKLFRVDKKPNGQWNEPKELPGNINTGNSQSPRIMADSETLIFASDKIPGGKGGMDLYVTRLVNGDWSNPTPLDFVNSELDDQFVTASALGRYLIKETTGARNKMELVEYLIPDDLRPKGMMKVEGSVTDENAAAVPAYITITDLTNGKRVYSGRPAADGSYFVYVREGTRYEFSVDPEQSKLSYFTKLFDLTSEKIPQREKISVVLKQPSPGDEILLNGIQFQPFTAQLDASSDREVKKLVRMMKANPEMIFEIQVLLEGYEEDSLQSSNDLTEMRMDSITTVIEEIDSLGQAFKRDTVLVKTFYHNDRTQKQAEAITNQLVTAGINSDNLKTLTNAIAAIVPGDRKLIIKAVPRLK